MFEMVKNVWKNNIHVQWYAHYRVIWCYNMLTEHVLML